MLASETSWRIRMSVAENPGTSTATLERLAVDSDDSVRRSVAENPNTPVRAIQQLEVDNDYSVRSAVAGNIKLQPDRLEKMAADNEASVRAAVARNPSAPPGVLSRLAQDQGDHVRRWLIDNPSLPLPDQVAENLSMAQDRYIRSVAEQKLMGSGYLYSFERLSQLLSVDITNLDLLADIHNSENIDERSAQEVKGNDTRVPGNSLPQTQQAITQSVACIYVHKSTTIRPG